MVMRDVKVIVLWWINAGNSNEIFEFYKFLFWYKWICSGNYSIKRVLVISMTRRTSLFGTLKNKVIQDWEFYWRKQVDLKKNSCLP